MRDKLCHCCDPHIVSGLESAEDRVVESSAGSNHSDQASTDYFHWGQRGTYPGGTSRFYCSFLINLSTCYPGGTC